MKILSIVGARPNFIKIAPLIEEMAKDPKIKSVLVHTGQHYDYEMSKVFFHDLNIPEPDYNLAVGSGRPVSQIAKIMEGLDEVFEKERPDLVVVVGDVNSTLAGALAANKSSIQLAHVEAGLRSFDFNMPEEMNRVLTDHLADYLFTTEPSAAQNLKKEGIKKEKIFFVGNVMIDTLLKYKKKVLDSSFIEKSGLKPKSYGVLTIHRPENIDKKVVFEEILEGLEEIQKQIKIIWPVHPRAQKQLKNFDLLRKVKQMENLKLIMPLGYLEMLSLINRSRLVLTDSGGLQEETTTLHIPCLTIRKNTERPITVQAGTNEVVGLKKENIIKKSSAILRGKTKRGRMPSLWDGRASKRIIKILRDKF